MKRKVTLEEICTLKKILATAQARSNRPSAFVTCQLGTLFQLFSAFVKPLVDPAPRFGRSLSKTQSMLWKMSKSLLSDLRHERSLPEIS